jgi:hypothetical protein
VIRQEAEANTFAIELLAPRKRLGPYLRGDPDLAAILSVSDEFDISREAAARRYVSCHDETLAAVFGHNGCFLYCDRSREFPWLSFRMGQRLPALPPGIGDSGVSVVDEAEASQWLSKSDSVSLTVQTLHQREGYSTTLLRTVAAPGDDEEEDADDVYERFTRFRGR